jgi:hypothetical protein
MCKSDPKEEPRIAGRDDPRNAGCGGRSSLCGDYRFGPAPCGHFRPILVRNLRGMKRRRRSFAPNRATKDVDLQGLYGSDGTRTRDLRRDRPLRGSRGERRRARDLSVHAALGLSVERFRMFERSRFGRLLPVCCPRRPLGIPVDPLTMVKISIAAGGSCERPAAARCSGRLCGTRRTLG